METEYKKKNNIQEMKLGISYQKLNFHLNILTMIFNVLIIQFSDGSFSQPINLCISTHIR